jgi:hypothetical protein
MLMASGTAQAAEPRSMADQAPAARAATVASGAVEDSRKACMARVPKEASEGQRMMAEQSCDRDEGERKSIDSVPGR